MNYRKFPARSFTSPCSLCVGRFRGCFIIYIMLNIIDHIIVNLSLLSHNWIQTMFKFNESIFETKKAKVCLHEIFFVNVIKFRNCEQIM